jgi:hypothetical protein
VNGVKLNDPALLPFDLRPALIGKLDRRLTAMPKFTILSRKDAFVDYLAEVEAETPEAGEEIEKTARGNFV